MLNCGHRFFALVLLLEGCGSASNFGGKSGSSKSQDAGASSATPPAPVVSADASGTPAPVATPPVPDAAPLDISKTGLSCKDMASEVGGWTGTYNGNALVAVPDSGKINFEMLKTDNNTLGVKNFQLDGGLLGFNQIKSISIDFDLHCGDLTLHDAVVQQLGLTLTVKLALTGQTFNPPTFTGTWTAQTQGFAVNIATGTWAVAKK